MHRMRIVSLTKLPRIASIRKNERIFFYGPTRATSLVTPSFALPPQQSRTIHSTRPSFMVTSEEIDKGFFSRMFDKINIFDTGKYRRKMMGYLVYEDTVKQIAYIDFFRDFKMADTFYSWFVITELHVWMLMVRYMAAGKHGREIRNSMVEAMWSDVNSRKSELKNVSSAVLKSQVKELSYQFNAAIIDYDEGILSDDKVLAGALWRRLYQSECNDPELLEKLVIYVRKQMVQIDKIPNDEILIMKTIKWMDYRNI